MSSRRRRRGRGKRPRDEDSAPDQQTFAPYHHSDTTLSYTDRAFSKGQNLQQSPSPISPAFSQPQQSLHNINQAPPGKVAIPPLRTTQQSAESSQGNKRGRTSHACDSCRRSKAGCTGGQPCMRCNNANVPCVYGDGKRDRERKEMSKLSEEATNLNQHNAEILDALRRIQRDDSLSLKNIRTALDEILSLVPSRMTPKDVQEGSLESSQVSPQLEELSGEDLDTEIGSTGSLDAVNVDTDRDEIRATGHLGKASSVAWTRRIAQECDSNTHQETLLGTHETGYALASYHTEDDDVEFVELTNVNPYDWPEYETANSLMRMYFDSVHGNLPLLDRQRFTTRFENFPRGADRLSPADAIWLGSLNLVFAISAVYAQLSQRHGRGHHYDHLIYLERAKLLCLDRDLLFEDGRVATCRMLGLLSFYFIATCRLNRAWTFCGLAIRQALTLGLQVRSHVEGLDEYEKEQRVRLWWSLYTLECLLNELTGRPSCIADQDISAPLPINVDENDLQPHHFEPGTASSSPNFSRRTSRDSRRGSEARLTATYQMPIGILQEPIHKFPVLSLPTTTSTYFIYRIQLCIVSHEIVTQLYCAATTKVKWASVQDTIRRIDARLLSWQDSLPPEFNTTFDKWSEPDWNDPHILQRLGLAMFFNSSRMILHRPCLCRFGNRVQFHSKKSQDFNQQGAEKCIESARTMISLIHWSASSVEKLYAISPWWNTLHYLCEALSVLILEMAFQAQHLPSEAAYILEDAKNGIRWLRTMAGESVSARKAWEIFDCLLRLVAPLISWSVFDMPTEAPVPPGYNYARFMAARTELPGSARRNEVRFQSQAQAQAQAQVQTSAWGQHNPEAGFASSSSSTGAFHDGSGSSDLGFSGMDPGSGFASGLEGGTGLGVGGVSGGSYEHVSNPLDHSTAVQLFGSIGMVHGQYDEPWQHMFASGIGSGFDQGFSTGFGGQGEGVGEEQGRGFGF